MTPHPIMAGLDPAILFGSEGKGCPDQVRVTPPPIMAGLDPAILFGGQGKRMPGSSPGMMSFWKT
jgi:hypothetical protein